MKNLQRNLARLAAAATASALLVALPASVAHAGTAACVGKATVGGTEITQNTTTNSALTHNLPATLDVGSPARVVNVVSDSSIDKEASGTAWSIGGRSVKGSTEASVVIGSDPTRVPLPLDIPGVNMTEGQATYLKAYGSFAFTPPSVPQKVVFKTPDYNFNAVTKFYDGPLGTGNIRIDVQAVCDPAGEDVIGAPVFVMARSTTTMATIEGPLTANSSTQVPVSVTVSGGVVSGKVRLVIDGNERPVKTLVNGKALLTLDNLTEGAHKVGAAFVPNDPMLYHGSVSPVQDINVGPPAIVTTTTLGLAKKTVSSSEPVVATATVNAASGSPAGTVTFSADGVDAATRPLAAGSTSVQVSLTGLAPGARDIQARFIPSAPLQYASSVSDIATVVVRTPATPTTTTVSVDKNPATTTDVVKATATVTAPSGTVSGTVQFYVDGTIAGGATPVSGGVATRTLGRLSTPGAREITAEFTPTNPADFEASNATTTVTVTAPGTPTTTTMVLSATSGTSASTLVATVTVAGGDTIPVGSVDLLVDGAKVASESLNSSGVATVSLPALDAGTRSVRAVFLPAKPLVDQASQSASQQVTITTVTSRTDLTVDPDNASAGRDITATAQVSTSAGTPQGTVDFFINGVRRVSAEVGPDGTASATLPALDQGSYQVVATFVPAKPGQQVGSSSEPRTLTLTQPVEAAPTTTLAALEESTITADDEGQVTAVVESAGATPRGRIDILISGETLSTTLTEGRATVSLPQLAKGDHTFVVKFVPANAQIFKPSQAGPLTLHVVRSAARTTTRLALSPATAAAGEDVTATASVSTSRGTPLGSVAFSVDGGAETLVVLSGLTASYQLSGLDEGSNTISARFVPTNRLNFAASTAPDQTAIVLSTPKVGTATGLSIAPSLVHENDIATATVSVSAAVGTPTGSVEVSMSDDAGFNEVVSGTLSNGTATIALPTYLSGTFDVRARYLPTDGTHYDESQSGARALTVTPPPLDSLQTRTTVSLSPDKVTVGARATARAAVVWAGGPARGTVKFYADSQLVGQPVVVADGTASIVLPTAIAKSFSITAQFEPLDPTDMAASTSEPIVLRVSPDAPVRTMTVVQLSPATIVDGQVSTASAKVTAESGEVEGVVTFSVDGIETEVPLTAGTAVLPLTNYGVGEYLIGASFAPALKGDSTPSTSGTEKLTVTPAPVEESATNTVLTLGNTKVDFGEVVSAQVVVTALNREFPVGQAVVTAGGATFRATLIDGSATLSLPALAVGTHAVTAAFEPAVGARFTPSAADSQTILVNEVAVAPAVPAPTTTSTTLALDTSVGHLGSTVTVRASVTGASEGQVRISTGWKTVTVPLVNGVATATVQLTAMGTSHITATYLPVDTSATPSIATTTIRVTKALTRVSLRGKFRAKRRSVNVTGAVTAEGGLTFCTGRMEITVLADGKRALKVQVPMTCSGKVRRLFTDLRPAKKYTVIAAYRGSSTTQTATKKIVVKGSHR